MSNTSTPIINSKDTVLQPRVRRWDEDIVHANSKEWSIMRETVRTLSGGSVES